MMYWIEYNYAWHLIFSVAPLKYEMARIEKVSDTWQWIVFDYLNINESIQGEEPTLALAVAVTQDELRRMKQI